MSNTQVMLIMPVGKAPDGSRMSSIPDANMNINLTKIGTAAAVGADGEIQIVTRADGMPLSLVKEQTPNATFPNLTTHRTLMMEDTELVVVYLPKEDAIKLISNMKDQ